MGTGKHSALKQSNDGSFELVVTDELELVEASSGETQPETAVTEAGGRPLRWILVVLLLFGLTGGGAYALLSGDGTPDDESADEDLAGFKPYVGESAIEAPVDVVRPSAPARRQVADPREEPVAEPPEMVELEVVDGVDEDHWKVEEGEEIVESEEVPPEFYDQVGEAEGEIELDRDGTRLADPKKLNDIRQRINQDIEIRKTLPKLNIDTQRLNQRFNPGNATGPANLDDITVIDEEGLEEAEGEEYEDGEDLEEYDDVE